MPERSEIPTIDVDGERVRREILNFHGRQTFQIFHSVHPRELHVRIFVERNSITHSYHQGIFLFDILDTLVRNFFTRFVYHFETVSKVAENGTENSSSTGSNEAY